MAKYRSTRDIMFYIFAKKTAWENNRYLYRGNKSFETVQ
jgi:hypothetical protein